MRHARRQVLFGAVLAVVVVLSALAVLITGTASERPLLPPPQPASVPGGATPGPSTPPPTIFRRSPNE